MTQFGVAASIVIVGAIAGVFLRPKTIALLGVALFALCVLGILVGAVLGMENLTFLSGVAGMAVPFIAGLSFLGSLAGAWMRRVVTREDPRKN